MQVRATATTLDTVAKQDQLLRLCQGHLAPVCMACVQLTVAARMASVKTAINTSQALKGGTAALKAEMAQIDLGEIEDNLDDMAELLEESNEIQEVYRALVKSASPVPCRPD